MRFATPALIVVLALAVAGVAWAQSIRSVKELVDAFTREEIKHADIPAQYAALAKTRAARRAARVEVLERTLGAEVFARKEVQAELAKHHRILALLERARLVTETELQGFRRASTLVRIVRLRTKEIRRHRETMERIGGAPVSP